MKQKHVLLGEDLINFRVLFLEILKFSEFLMDLSKFFFLTYRRKKKRVFEKSKFKMKNRYISIQSCVMRSGLKRQSLIKVAWILSFKSLVESGKFAKPIPVLKRF